ncbi:MAG: cation-transporting P-type ATPase, partial [Gaiellaceae bacterium]
MASSYELDLAAAAALPAAAALTRLDSDASGLSSEEAAKRLRTHGPNALRSHGVSALAVLVRQLRSYLLLLL